MLIIDHFPSKQLTFCQATWDGIGFVPGLLTGVNTVEFIVSLVNSEDLLGEFSKELHVFRYFFL